MILNILEQCDKRKSHIRQNKYSREYHQLKMSLEIPGIHILSGCLDNLEWAIY